MHVQTSQQMDKRLFVAKVVGHSTEDGIPDGSWGLFRLFTAGAVLAATALDGKRVIVQLRDQADPETGGRYTLKRWRVALAPVLNGIDATRSCACALPSSASPRAA
jgi:hypothetical protein